LVKSAITCKQRANLDVLEVQRQLFTLEARALRQLVRVDLHRPDFEHELVVALVGAVLPAPRGSTTMRTCRPLWKVDTLCTGVPKSVTSSRRRRLGQRRAQELDHQALALLADVDTDLRAGQRSPRLRPAPSGPRRKSMSRRALDLGWFCGAQIEPAGRRWHATGAPL
jgi:hypothetical protein